MRPNDFDAACKGLSKQFFMLSCDLKSRQVYILKLMRSEEQLKKTLVEKDALLTEATGLLIEAMEENSGTNEHVLGRSWQQRASQFLQKVRGGE